MNEVVFGGVSKTYAGNKVKAVDHLDLSLNAGEIFGFLGPNGAGKTTTIKMLTGILSIDEGGINVFGSDITRSPIEAKKHIGFVTDSGVLFDKLTGREFVDFMADMYGVSAEDRKARSEELIDRFALREVFDRQIGTYSHGMQQKIAIVGALVHDPDVLVLDEPMVGLDPQSVRQFKDIMRTHADKGNVVFFSTHVLDMAEKICDRIGIINGGRLIVAGDLDEIKTAKGDESLEDIFLSVAGTAQEV